MFQNIKVDIIYYKTNTDFELEFNLCGCCRMRLLTDKSADKKNLVHNLARAVSRSRVIIIAGNLFGEDGIIEITANSISRGTEVIDNNAYGISAESEIKIISGATPLVTPEGYFGGCIIESGPQSMILLSDNKAIRKTIMNTLIHPYVEELCAADLKEKAASVTANMEETPEEEAEQEAETLVDAELVTEDVVAEDLTEQGEDELSQMLISEELQNENSEAEQDISEEIIENIKSEEDSYIIDQNDNFSAYDEEIDMYIEPEKTREQWYEEEEEIAQMLSEEAAAYHTEEEVEEEVKLGISGIPILILAIILLIVIGVLSYCIFYVPSSNGVAVGEYIKEIFNTLFV